jgi:tetratricopeptide (TPR) repeat protein
MSFGDTLHRKSEEIARARTRSVAGRRTRDPLNLPRSDTVSRPMRLSRTTLIALALVASASTASAQVGIGRIPFPIRGGTGSTAHATPFELAIGRGDQALRRADYATARSEFQNAARLNPSDARPPFYLAEVEVRQGNFAAAEPHLRNAIRLNPRMAEAHAELGNVLREQHHLPEAIREFESAIRLDGQLAEAHLMLAMSLEDQNQRDRAIAEYRTAARLAPDDALAPLNLGMLLAAAHPAQGSAERAEALRMLNAAVRNAHDDRAILANAGPALRSIGEAQLAAQVLERVRAAGNPSAAVLAELSQALWASGQRTQAITRIEEALRADGSRADFHYVHGLMLAGQGDRAGALAEMRTVVRLGAGTPLAQQAQRHATELEHAH